MCFYCSLSAGHLMKWKKKKKHKHNLNCYIIYLLLVFPYRNFKWNAKTHIKKTRKPGYWSDLLRLLYENLVIYYCMKLLNIYILKMTLIVSVWIRTAETLNVCWGKGRFCFYQTETAHCFGPTPRLTGLKCSWIAPLREGVSVMLID